MLSLIYLFIQVAAATWELKNFTSFVSFGDSYTDQSRLDAFGSNVTAPPVGWVQPDNNNTASGGYTWGHYIAATGVNLYNYAVSGASSTTPHRPAINSSPPPPDETVYSIWIGTNDLGNNAFITDSQTTNKTIPDYTGCIYAALDQVYSNGGRYFILMNAAPLQLAPLYATPEHNGVGQNHYWPNKPENLTEVSFRMWEQVATVNAILKYQTAYEVMAGRYAGAHFAVMDMNGLMTDMYNHPSEYFGGSANVSGFVKHCDLSGSNCASRDHPEGYLWYDELHPSERTDEIIAQHFMEVVRGESKWATYW
ncbi:hypothetical protein MW887_005812 [Aspergillus wentii]|nr:hypothetical protein MW887_005812 [Aspergillus wentii]